MPNIIIDPPIIVLCSGISPANSMPNIAVRNGVKNIKFVTEEAFFALLKA
jgi:hypothetical protein